MASASPKSCTIWVLATASTFMLRCPCSPDARQRIFDHQAILGVKAGCAGCRFNPAVVAWRGWIRRRFASRDVFGAGDMAKRLAQPGFLQNHVDFVP